MLRRYTNIIKFIVLIVLSIITIIIVMPKTYAGLLTPTSDQKIQFRAVELKENNGKQQLIVEAWIQNLDFKGIDLRLQYDTSLLSISSLETNEVINISDPLITPSNFEFCNNFEKFMEIGEYDSQNGELRIVYSNLTQDEVTDTSDNYIVDEEIGEYIHITDYMLIGRFSFQVGEGEITEHAIALKEAETTPKTGIKINVDGQGNYYEEQSIFEFILDLESDNAYLSNMILSTGEKNEEIPENSTYKEYNLDPTFDKETFAYNVEILEYIDEMNLKITKDDEKSTIIMKVPKKDEDGNLMYEDDETTIIYEEIEITDSENLTQEVVTKVKLNKLGEPDTIVELKVTAEDGTTIKEYIVTIKRPYGTIKGSIKLGETLREKAQISNGIYVEYIADIKAYKSGEFIWEDILTETTNYSVLDAMPIINQVQSDKDDGSFELFLIPGTYDVFMEKLGFTQVVNKQITINESDVIDLGENILHEGDINRDGIVDITDLTSIVRQNGQDSSDPSGSYSEKYDFQKKGYIDITDITSVSSSLKERKELVINNLGNI